MEDKKKYEHPKCFLPEKGNPYPLCIGQWKPECEECQFFDDYKDLVDDLYTILNI